MTVSIAVRGLALPVAFAAALGVTTSLFPVNAQEAPQEPAPTVAETIQVTATRTPEDVETVPASVTVISGEELAARGVIDLASALALASGVSVAPGGDNGPAGSVPEIWGLREFDAFLLVVDDVPWGGAFNPALATLDLVDVERIEILRGAAPVLYGATSFVGVIHVIHRAAGAPGRGGQPLGRQLRQRRRLASRSPLPGSGRFKQSLTVDGERQGFKDDRTGFDRGHLLYRAAPERRRRQLPLRPRRHRRHQDPASPHAAPGRVALAAHAARRQLQPARRQAGREPAASRHRL